MTLTKVFSFDNWVVIPRVKWHTIIDYSFSSSCNLPIQISDSTRPVGSTCTTTVLSKAELMQDWWDKLFTRWCQVKGQQLGKVLIRNSLFLKICQRRLETKELLWLSGSRGNICVGQLQIQDLSLVSFVRETHTGLDFYFLTAFAIQRLSNSAKKQEKIWDIWTI